MDAPPTWQPWVPPAPRSTDPTRPRLWSDVIFAGCCLVVFGLPTLAFTGDGAWGSGAWYSQLVTVLAAVVMPTALVWRRTRPITSAVVIYACALAHFALGAAVLPADALIFAALYSVTVHGPAWARNVALGSALLGSLLLSLKMGLETFTSRSDLIGIAATFAFLAVAVLLFWAIGLLRRSRMERVESLAERAARLERERDQQAQIATAAERARIAREMHDIVAHSLSVVIAQADGGRYAATADPEAAATALATISETGRAALTDMRRILGVLREEEGSADSLIPQPDESDLAALVDQVRETGLEVSYVNVGTPRPMPPGTGLTVYRIVQEALTNVLKHAGPGAKVTVFQQWAPQNLVLSVEDNGRGAAATSDGAGHGLLGMRERAAMLGGTLAAGPRPGGGFRIRAEIPIPPLHEIRTP